MEREILNKLSKNSKHLEDQYLNSVKLLSEDEYNMLEESIFKNDDDLSNLDMISIIVTLKNKIK